jgi:hypothetical protein
MSKDWWDDSPLHPANQNDDDSGDNEMLDSLELDREGVEALVHVVLSYYDLEKQDQKECGCKDHLFHKLDSLKECLEIAGIDMDQELSDYRIMLNGENEDHAE